MYKEMFREYLNRANMFANWRIKKNILTDIRNIDATCRFTKEIVPFEKRLSLPEKPIKEGEVWGSAWESAWFHITGTVPNEWKGKEVVLQLDFNGEGLVYQPDGTILQGISNGSIFSPHYGARDIIRLFPKAKGGEKIDLWVETSASNLFGIDKDGDQPRTSPTLHGSYCGKVNHLKMALFNEDLYQLWIDIDAALGLVRALQELNKRRAQIIYIMNEALNIYMDDPANAKKAHLHMQKIFNSRANASASTAHAVGHAHLDVGWMWPVRESVRKSARTFSSQLDLINRYPGYIFGASQPQLYAFVKEYYPKLYERVKEAVKKGQWELQGAMWVEADCNISSGEALIRQVIHGKNFYMDEFGIDVKNLWLPDVFGYSANLPQILKKAGVDYFLTQKISWNQFTTFPYHTFFWKGIDSTTILSHFLPENNYNSNLQPDMLIWTEERFAERHIQDDFMILFGIGDGGGGPKEDQIERGLRLKDCEGAPLVRFGMAKDFFDKISANTSGLKTWDGELYLELHRGTYTTQAKTKKGNRALENSLRQTEALLSCDALSHYPIESLDRIWKVLLLNQFHDILPGSSIHKVYEVTEKEHMEALLDLEKIQKDASKRILTKSEGELTLFNALSDPYQGVIELPSSWNNHACLDASLNPLSAQKEEERLFTAVKIPAYSFLTLKKGEKRENTVEYKEISSKWITLENDEICYTFTQDGRMSRATDKKENRELIAEDQEGNLIKLFIDRPHNWDAWDIDFHYQEQMKEIQKASRKARFFEGAVRKGILFSYTIGTSKIEQKIILENGSKRLDFETTVDWQENHKLLRVYFPVALINAKAHYEIQYGFVQRNNHTNTLADFAKFETVAHRYADLSNSDYGIALLNDCKYGHQIIDNVMSITLLKSPADPDPIADIGTHQFTYSFYPHADDLPRSQTIEEASMLNIRPLLFENLRANDDPVPCRIESAGIKLETIKRAEKEESLIIRVVETRGIQSQGTLVLHKKFKKCTRVDLMEWNELEQIAISNNRSELKLTPFEIATFKLTF